MKKFAFLVAFALLALTLPMSAVETPEAVPAAPVVTLQEQIEGPATPLMLIKPPIPIPFCWQVQGTSCPQVGATKACTDVCSNQLSCTCVAWSGQRFWNCQQEC